MIDQQIVKKKHKEKNRVDVIYTQQENLKPNNESKIMYEDITEQIKIGIEGKQQVLTFNAKIAATIEGNETKVTKGWTQLLKLGNKGNMITLNIVKAECKGVWKRVQVAERSIYAYVLTDMTSANTVKVIKVDVQNNMDYKN